MTHISDEGQYPDGERWRKEFDACVLFRLIMKFALLTWLIWSAVVVFQYYDKVIIIRKLVS